MFSRHGSLYARELPGKGAPHASSGSGRALPPGAQIAAVLSDDDRAIVAWTDRHDGQTSVYVSRSQPGVRFTGPQLLEEFPDPPDLPDYVGSPRLVRLSSESVMLAWTGAVAGHWAIRAAAIDLNGVHPAEHDLASAAATRCSPTSRPDRTTRRSRCGPNRCQIAAGLDLGSQAIFAARGFDAYPEQVEFAAARTDRPAGAEQRSRPSRSTPTATARSRPGAPARARSPMRCARPGRPERRDGPAAGSSRQAVPSRMPAGDLARRSAGRSGTRSAR